MNNARSNKQFIILAGGLLAAIIIMGSVFYIYSCSTNKNISEYSNINRTNMHPLDSLIYKFL